MTREETVALIGEAALAPSVHNVQPARWRVEDGGAVLFEDVTRRLTVGDPRGNDSGISLGAAAEGLRLAAGRRGLRIDPVADSPPDEPRLAGVMRYRFAKGAAADPLAEIVERRQSWRGAFLAPTQADRVAAQGLAAQDAGVIVEQAALNAIAPLYDAASYGFMRRSDFRGELLSWLRLSPGHSRWCFDGLNAEAMAMGRLEAVAAGAVLGPGFRPLAAVGLAPVLLAEGGKIAKGAGVVVLHRPAEEAPFDSGAHFYRLWLRIEQAGFGAQVLAALADDLQAAGTLAGMLGLPPGRRVVSAFRIGRRPKGAAVERARLPLAEILV